VRGTERHGVATRRRQEQGVAATAFQKPSGSTKFRRVAGHPTRQSKKARAIMPKMKTKRGAAKRFRVRPSGKITRAQAYKRHILTKKTTKNKRQLRGTTDVHANDVPAVKALLPYA